MTQPNHRRTRRALMLLGASALFVHLLLVTDGPAALGLTAGHALSQLLLGSMSAVCLVAQSSAAPGLGDTITLAVTLAFGTLLSLSSVGIPTILPGVEHELAAAPVSGFIGLVLGWIAISTSEGLQPVELPATHTTTSAPPLTPE